MAKRELKVTLETVTPLFLGGANQQPELRAASFRGAMRFWLRAMLGGVYGDNLKAIKAKEAEVFGNTKRASAVVVRVKGDLGKAEPPLLDPKSQPGIYYMLWSVLQGQNKRKAWGAGETFTLTLLPRLSTQSEAMNWAAMSLWLLLNLGGIGTRSRRGAGGLKANDNPENWQQEWPHLATWASTPQDLAKNLSEGLQTWLRILDQSFESDLYASSSFDVLHPNCCQIYVVSDERGWATWQEALNSMGEIFKDFRNQRTPDYHNIKDIIQGKKNEVDTVERAVFGLPQPYFYRSLFDQHKREGDSNSIAGRKARAMVEPSSFSRRASPLWFHTTQLRSGNYVAVLTFFKSVFLPGTQDRIVIKPGDRKNKNTVICQSPDDMAINSFLDSLTNKWEITL